MADRWLLLDEAEVVLTYELLHNTGVNTRGCPAAVFHSSYNMCSASKVMYISRRSEMKETAMFYSRADTYELWVSEWVLFDGILSWADAIKQPVS